MSGRAPPTAVVVINQCLFLLAPLATPFLAHFLKLDFPPPANHPLLKPRRQLIFHFFFPCRPSPEYKTSWYFRSSSTALR